VKFETEFVDDLQLDRGYVSPYFVTNTDPMEATIENPYIIITDAKIRRCRISCAAREGAPGDQGHRHHLRRR
jgi:hypothetical protein